MSSQPRKGTNTRELVISALLTALGILIPIVMQPPFKVVIEPASFTLASHVPVIISIFVSPLSALIVSIGTALGFLLSGLPLVIAIRALSHIVFALLGAFMYRKGMIHTKNTLQMVLFCLLLAVVHALCEVLVVLPFYFGGALAPGFYDRGLLAGVAGLLGVGTIVHACIDFAIAVFIVRMLSRARVLNLKY